MSHNLYLIAERTILIESKNSKKKKYEKQRKLYNGLIQTPTEITNNILATNDPYSAYLEWCNKEYFADNPYIYEKGSADPNDYYGEPPIQIKVISKLQCHKEEIDNWIEEHMNDGYTVMWSSI